MTKTKKVYILGGALTILLIAYLVATWLSWMKNIQNYLLEHNNITYTLDEERTIKFTHASVYGFPFIFGVKLHNVEEITKFGAVKHNDPVKMGYNILTRKLYIQYTGTSIATVESTQDCLRIAAKNIELYSHYPITFWLSIIRNKATSIKLPQNFHFLANKVEVQNNDNVTILNGNGDIQVSIDKYPLLLDSLNETIRNLPKEYHVTAHISTTSQDPQNQLNITEDISNIPQHIITNSLMYMMTPTIPIEWRGQINFILGDIKDINKITDLAKYLKVEYVHKTASNDSEMVAILDNAKLNFKNKIKCKNIATTLKMIPKINKMPIEIINMLSDIVSILEGQVIETYFNATLNEQNDTFEAQVTEAKLQLRDIAVSMVSNIVFQNQDKWHMKGSVVLHNYNSLIQGLGTLVDIFAYNLPMQSHEKYMTSWLATKLRNPAFQNLFYKLLSHSPINAPDLMFKYEVKDDINNLKINTKYSLNDLTASFTTFFNSSYKSPIRN